MSRAGAIWTIALAAILLAAPASAQEAAPRIPSVAVTGAGEADLKPDFARILVAAVTQADTVQQAAEANRSATERVLARIQGLGVKREDIETASFQVFQTPRFGPDGREQRAPRFTARHQLRVTSRDLAGVGRLAGEILASGDITFRAVSWGLDRPEASADAARREAVRDARRQAEVYAEAAGVRLGRLLEIREGSVHRPGLPDAEIAMRMSAPSPTPEVPLVPPASVRHEATVQMVFEITQ